MFTFWTFWIFINNLSWWTRTILNTYTENILFQAYSEKSRSFEIRSCTVTEATLIRFVSIIAQVPPDPRFSLSVLLIFGMVCHLTIRISHRYYRFKRCINSMDFSDYLEFVWLQILFRILICVCCIVLCSSLISGQLSVLLYCSCCSTLSFQLLYWANKWLLWWWWLPTDLVENLKTEHAESSWVVSSGV